MLSKILNAPRWLIGNTLLILGVLMLLVTAVILKTGAWLTGIELPETQPVQHVDITDEELNAMFDSIIEDRKQAAEDAAEEAKRSKD